MKKIVTEYILIIIGSLIMAFGTSVFLLPNKLSTGGFTGLATILYYYFKVSMGTSIIIMNLPLFILSYLKIRKKIFNKNNFCHNILLKNVRFYGKHKFFYR